MPIFYGVWGKAPLFTKTNSKIFNRLEPDFTKTNSKILNRLEKMVLLCAAD